MPGSPSIPVSFSDPGICKSLSPSSSQSYIPPTNVSCSTNSVITSAWPNKLLVGSNITNQTTVSTAKKLDLNKERLDEFGRSIEVFDYWKSNKTSPYYKGLTDSSLVIKSTLGTESYAATSVVGSNPYYEGQSYTTSPYYEGLTDSSLIINRQRLPVSGLGTESYTVTSGVGSNPYNNEGQPYTISRYYEGLTDSSLVTNRQRLPESSLGTESYSATSRSNIIVKMQGWGSYLFSSKNKEEKYSIPSEKINKGSLDTVVMTSSLSSSKIKETTTINTIVKEMDVEKEDISGSVKESDITVIANEGKSMRERVSEPPASSSPPPPPPSLSPPSPQTLPQPPVKPSPPTIERQFIWADKYRPEDLKDFLCNRNKALELQELVKEGDCGNFIFEGSAGVGKRTMIRAVLREFFGADKIQAREECKKFDFKGEAVGSINVNLKESSHHIELNLSELQGYEKHVIIELIKEKKFSNKAVESSRDNCRAIVLNEADKLSTDALLYIRWLLEKHKGYNNKVLFCCTDVSKLQPIKPLCTIVQLLPPSNQEIVEVLEFIAKQEGITLPHQLAVTIANNSKNNLRQAIRSFEATWQFNPSLKEEQEIKTGWEDDIANIAKNIVEEQSPKQLYIFRGKLQNLIEHNVSADFIFQTLVDELKRHSNENAHPQIDDMYQEYNRDEDDSEKKPFAFSRSRHDEMSKNRNDPMRKNIQLFMKIEEFIAKFMSCYKKSVCPKRVWYNDAL